MAKMNMLNEQNIAMVIGLVDLLSNTQNRKLGNQVNVFQKARESGKKNLIPEDEVDAFV